MKKLLPYFLAALIGLAAGYGLFVLLRHSISLASDAPASATSTPTPSPTATPVVVSHIVSYHYIRTGVSQTTDPNGYALSITPTQFGTEITAMKAAGYTSETMANYAAGKGNAKTVVLTFEGGYEDFYTNAYPILKENGWTATVYIATNNVGDGYMTWSQLKTLEQNGVEIASATVDNVDLTQLSTLKQESELSQSKTILQENVGGSVVSFSYPVGDYTTATANLVKAAGYTSAVTTTPGSVKRTDNLFTLSRVKVTPGMTTSAFLASLTS